MPNTNNQPTNTEGGATVAEPLPLIVTRHAGAVNWLRRCGIEGEVVVHATPEQIAGRIVYGVLPLHLACHARQVWSIDLPNLPAERRGQDLSADEMDEAGANLAGYIVHQVVPEPDRCPICGERGCEEWPDCGEGAPRP